MRILIVDDDFAIRKILSIWFRAYGESSFAANGRQALDAVINSYTEDKPYDLICLDVMMPEMNGIDALKAIRQYEDEHGVDPGNRIKVILATAAANPKSIMGAFNEQCEAYLVKPIDQQELTQAIKKLGL